MPPAGTQPLKPPAPSAASKEANEYIPSFISKKPFYIGEDDQNDYLEHQRLQKAQSDQSKWYDRGKKLGPAATKFRKGACENCGSITHKTKECLSRPRAKGAKWTGLDIQADEVIQDVNLGWDAKRDRWNGYDSKEYKTVIEEYAQLEELRTKSAANEAADEGETGADGGAKYAEESDMGRHQSTSTRQLRIREDTAKYLLNLDLDSAKYDPKTRSMVDSGATADTAAALVAEEGFMRSSGDAAEFEKAQKYAWESQEKAGDTNQHLQANPTSGEYYRRKEREEAEKKRLLQKKMLEEKYGASGSTVPEGLRDTAIIESERFVEYDETGALKGAPKAVAKSKYAEDVLINNHAAVWVKNSYCTGEAGKAAFNEADHLRTGGALQREDAPLQITSRQGRAESEAEASANKGSASQDAAKKRTLEEMKGDLTEEDMDEYRRKRQAPNDPMAHLLGKDKLL
ncbi:mRNA splicing protein [Pseudogymnoascus destructans]|uniref:Pre-mRNA-splicing factor SLU7 n=1 Tax=Pseudogymnoascus destructans TaxID=655981 RepID=A0A177AGG6_9PEZI|nr:mRNA splicing protein [Pseudogymnoascus destructans]OAF61177.1 mRNA splicing protein [Pseudogymnoascus destructans]